MPRMVVAILACVVLTSSAFGQVREPETAGNPLTERHFGFIASTGKTMPPSRAASPTSRDDIARRSANEQQEDALAKSICVGCGVK